MRKKKTKKKPRAKAAPPAAKVEAEARAANDDGANLAEFWRTLAPHCPQIVSMISELPVGYQRWVLFRMGEKLVEDEKERKDLELTADALLVELKHSSGLDPLAKLADLGKLQGSRDADAAAKSDEEAVVRELVRECNRTMEDAARSGAARRLIRAQLAAAAKLEAETAGAKPKAAKRGRPSATQQELERDRRIAEAWESRQYRTFEELAGELGLRPLNVQQAIWRVRARKKSARQGR